MSTVFSPTPESLGLNPSSLATKAGAYRVRRRFDGARGLAAMLLSFFSGFATPEGLLATPNALYLALIALLNLTIAPSAAITAASTRQQLQSIACVLLILAAVLQALVLLAPLPSIGNQPAIWLSLLITGVAVALHLACQLPRETDAIQAPQAKVATKAETAPAAAVTPEEDRETGTVSRLDSHFPEEAQVLSPVTPLVFTASDGRRIHGFLIRPRGVSGPVPLVVDIHGGPWARDTWAPAIFNGRQMLANRGYAVLQLNYRGSAGYGRDHMWAGAMEYNGRLQQDIAEGVQWAIDQGVADSKRLAVMGASFGGFSVLAQMAQKRHDYRCGIDIVGVADWPRLIESWPPFWRNRHMFVRFYGDPADPAQRAAMLRNSPVSYLDQISAPLLVVHGANDIRVLRQDSDDVVAALRQRGHPVEYLLFPDEGHSISKWRNRLAMWRTVEDTLASCLGGRSAGFDFYELMPRGR